MWSHHSVPGPTGETAALHLASNILLAGYVYSLKRTAGAASAIYFSFSVVCTWVCEDVCVGVCVCVHTREVGLRGMSDFRTV